MKLEFFLRKMDSLLEGEEVRYYLSTGEDMLSMNQMIGQKLRISSEGLFRCSCGKESAQAFRSGFCKSCFFESPLAGDSIFRPELATAHLGKEDRDLEWEKRNQLQPHIVYLSETDKVKVGVTRKQQVPTRWIDQGATQAVALVEVSNRYLAGVTEVALKDFFADKTSYQGMLKKGESTEDLHAHLEKAMSEIPEEVTSTDWVKMPYGDKIWNLNFPVKTVPTKVKSVKMVEDNQIESTLVGIKGQYLLFENQQVLNVRNNEGQKVKWEIL